MKNKNNMINRVKPNKLSDQVFEQLRDNILDGSYKLDEMLPPERELCDMFGVNRSSVREALKRLEQVGLIEIRHGSGCLVLNFMENAEFSILKDMIVPGGKLNALSAKPVRSMLEFRTIFFPGFARLAAGRIGDSDIEALEDILTQMKSIPGDDARSFQMLDLAFHSVVIRAADSLALSLLFNSYKNMYFKTFSELTVLFGEQDRQRIYRAILDALREHDETLCEQLYRSLIEAGNVMFERILLNEPEDNTDKQAIV